MLMFLLMLLLQISSDRRHGGVTGSLQQAPCSCGFDGRALSTGPASSWTPRHHYRLGPL